MCLSLPSFPLYIQILRGRKAINVFIIHTRYTVLGPSDPIRSDLPPTQPGRGPRGGGGYNDLIYFSHFEAKLNLGMNNFDYFIFGKQRNKNDIFNKLSACNCCKKHQTNKPKKLEPWIETEFHDTQHRECNCICRHYTRWLCRHID